jgi:excinuclease ABC subunit A
MAGRRLVIDRFDPAREPAERVSEAIADAYRWGQGACAFLPRAGGAPIQLARSPLCPAHGAVLPDELTPRHFSFNSHLGACPACAGLGRRVEIDPDLLLPHPALPLGEAMEPAVAALVLRSPRNRALLAALYAQHGVPEDRPVDALPAPLRAAVLHGAPSPLAIRYARSWGGGAASQIAEEVPWPGLLGLASGWARAASLRRETRCSACGGARLSPVVRSVRVGEGDGALAIHEAVALTVAQAAARWGAMGLRPHEQLIAAQPIEDMLNKLRFLDDVGLGYLTLDRASDSLSGGESQRIRLATQLGARLTGTLYVLDEPTVGLHPRDTARLMDTLEGLRDLGNTLVVVEHDLEVIRRADHLIDMGPAAGEHGGRVVGAGSPAALARGGSLTGRYLSGALSIPIPTARRSPRGHITTPPAHLHNLQGAVLRLPLGCLTAVTGVSGSGKSSIVMEHLVDHLAAQGVQTLGRAPEDGPEEPGEAAPAARKGRGRAPKVEGLPQRLVIVDQRPIGRSPRSTPATWSEVWDPIRALFAEAPLSRERGWTPGRFSWNTPGGRCEACQGRGSTLVEMHFLSDIWLPCEACGGRRFTRETLEVRWREHSIADVLDLDVASALALFTNQRRVRPRLQALVDVGLGYLRLGQPGNTLSGGEAQRLKLANELVSRAEETLYLLDEPTTGLHLADIDLLVKVLHRLVDQGHTVAFVEHQPDLIANADHVIDMGPEGGSGGGQIIAEGTPEQLAALPGSHTGRFLAPLLGSAR